MKKGINSIPDDIIITPQKLRDILPREERYCQNLIKEIKEKLGVEFLTYGTLKKELGVV